MKKFLLLGISIIVISCMRNGNDTSNEMVEGAFHFTDEDFEIRKKIQGEVLKNLSDSLLFSGTLSINGNYLIIDEIKSGKAFHIIELPQKEYLGLYGNKGRGPGEVLSIWPVLDAPPGFIRVLDNSTNKIVEYEIDSLLLNQGYSREYSTHGIFMDGLAIINDSIYFLDRNSKENRIFIADSSGSVVNKTGSLPEFKDVIRKNVPPDYYWADLDYEENVVAISYRFLPVIQIFNVLEHKWTILSGPDSVVRTINYSNYSSYNNIQVTDKAIYALYNGKKFEGDDWQHCNEVYVFNLQGEILRKYELDIGIKNFCIFKDEVLYGLRDSEEGQILIQFDLK